MNLYPIYLKFYLKVQALRRKYLLDREFGYWQSKKEELVMLGRRGYRLKIEHLGLDQEKLEVLIKTQQKQPEVLFAEIDQDGFLVSHFGPIRNSPIISNEDFLVRKGFKLEVVAIDGYVGVKKDYRGNKLSFLTELKALHCLGLAGCNVPSIMDVDFDNLRLTFSYILGAVVREELAKRGAVLRDRDIENNPDFKFLNAKERWLKRVQEGKRILYDVVDPKFVKSLFNEFKKIHASGFLMNDIKYGNIIIEKESGKPYLIDFELASDYRNLGRHSLRILHDGDIEKFNLHFNAEMLTYKSIREKIKGSNSFSTTDWYAPIYFGAGLRIGPIWDVDTGYGRWHYILKKHFPPLTGKRILDLGANNAFNSMQMLKYGAQEIIGIELDSKYITQGNFIKEVFEWVDNRLYNFKYKQADMKDIPRMNLGNFDLVIALCSLYYLDDESLSNLIHYISTITGTFILQCNNDKSIRRQDSHTYEKASVEYTVGALNSNGFPNAKVIAPKGYTRPLVVATNER